jgi:hypothetical protein
MEGLPTIAPAQDWKERYRAAYRLHYANKYPVAHATGYFQPKMPAVNKANGLTTFIINFLTWSGHRATRISSAGRYAGDRWIPGPTRKGSADISATIRGRSVMLEVKVGRDKPRPEQLAEQERERKAGGVFEFVHDPVEFFALYDRLINIEL